MDQFPSAEPIAEIAAPLLAAVIGAFGWAFRRHVKRVDTLEAAVSAMVTRAELEQARLAIDAELADIRREQHDHNTRIEAKIDSMHSNITERIDRLMLARGLS